MQVGSSIEDQRLRTPVGHRRFHHYGTSRTCRTAGHSRRKGRVMFAHYMTLLGWLEAEGEIEQAQLAEARRMVREVLDWANTTAGRNRE